MTDKQIVNTAVNLADELSDFVGELMDIPDIDEFLDSYDNDALGSSIDALYDFANQFAVDRQVY